VAARIVYFACAFVCEREREKKDRGGESESKRASKRVCTREGGRESLRESVCAKFGVVGVLRISLFLVHNLCPVWHIQIHNQYTYLGCISSVITSGKNAYAQTLTHTGTCSRTMASSSSTETSNRILHKCDVWPVTP